MYALKYQNDLKRIVSLAIEALHVEVELTSKPGLVDKRNSGAHDDMDINTFYVSIEAISPYFEDFLSQGYQDCRLIASQGFKNLKQIGIQCEKSMFAATKGVNTHKGAIFSMAVCLGAIGRLMGKNRVLDSKGIQKEIQKLCSFLVQKELSSIKIPISAGQKYYLTCKHGGIRQEAQEGYPIVFNTALPSFIFWASKEGEQRALKKTLLLIMSELDDTTIWSRGGTRALKFVQQYAKKTFTCKEDLEKTLKRFDATLIKKNLSPGGSADLLAFTYFLYRLLKNNHIQ